MPYIFGKLWHLAIIWAIRKAFQCILQGVRFLLANHTRLSPTLVIESYQTHKCLSIVHSTTAFNKTKVQIELCGGLDRSRDLVLRQRYCTWVLCHRLVMAEDRIQPEWPEIIRTAFIPSSHLWPPSTNCEMLRNRWFTFWWRKTAHKYNEWIFPKFFSTVCEQEGTISSLGFNPRASREL